MIYTQLTKDGKPVKIVEKKAEIAGNKYINFIRRNALVLLILEKKLLNNNDYEVSYELFQNGTSLAAKTSIFPNSENIHVLALQYC